MKRIFLLTLIILSIANAAFSEEFAVEQDIDAHRITGGLYAVAAVVNMNNRPSEFSAENLKEYFNSKANETAKWLNSVKITHLNGGLWAGVPVERFSGARRFLRANAAELSIMDKAGGRPWMGGEYAWLEISKKISINASYGTGRDNEILFLNLSGTKFWWQIIPEFTPKTRDAVMKKFALKNGVKPELHAPGGNTKQPEKFMASPVKLPDDIHVGGKTSGDFDVNMGDVTITPLPHRFRK